jgi:hypothetical protein
MVKQQQGYEAEHQLPPRAEVKNGGATPLLPISLHGIVPNYMRGV